MQAVLRILLSRWVLWVVPPILLLVLGGGVPFLLLTSAPGERYSSHVEYLLGALGYALFRLFGAHKHSQGHQKVQLRYLTAALSAGTSACTSARCRSPRSYAASWGSDSSAASKS